MKTNKPLKLSYSKISTYLQCPRKYKLQYKDYVIANYIPSPFFGGNAIDSASEVIFKSKMKGEEFVEFDRNRMIEAFTKGMTDYEFQLEKVYLPTSHLPRYAKADISLELLTDEDVEDILSYMKEKRIKGSIEEFMNETYPIIKKDRSKVKEYILGVYNYIAWVTLHHKGIMMLDALKQWVDENINEVISVQRKFKIVNDLDDELNGAMDIEAIMKDGTRRTLDLKTASNSVAQYPNNCVDTAMQLHIYSQESVPDVGYLIIDKDVRVREPRIRIRYVEGTVTENMLDKTFDTIEKVMDDIKCENFEMNKNACFEFGGCIYRGLCHYNSMKGLEKRKFDGKK